MPRSSFTVRTRLMTRGLSQRKIADAVSVSQPMVSRVLRGERTSRRVHDAIARAIDLTPEDLDALLVRRPRA